MLIWLPSGYYEERRLWQGVMLGAALITLVGALDDRYDMPPAVKLAGQVLAAVIVVHYGVAVKAITLPFAGKLALPNAGVTNAGPILTVIGLVAMMNVVNFSDGVDGLAAGVCAIIAAAMAVVAFDLGRQQPGVLAALTAGAALGFLLYNFPPASSFMGDCGANLLGLLMGVITVEAAVKTTAVVSFVLPLILLAVPFLDTTFVLLKRLKYKQPIYRPDSEHFHHRMARIGFSNRRTIAYLYAWTLMLAGLALALRFVPYSDHHGHLHSGWALVMIAIGLGRRRGQRVPRVRAGDLQVPPPRRDPPAPAAPRRLARGDRARRGARLRDRRVPDALLGQFRLCARVHLHGRVHLCARIRPRGRIRLSVRARRRARGGVRRAGRAR